MMVPFVLFLKFNNLGLSFVLAVLYPLSVTLFSICGGLPRFDPQASLGLSGQWGWGCCVRLALGV